jgi:hypothetical protein
LGNKLFVNVYKGDLGVFQVGPGGRKIGELKFTGSLVSMTHAVAIGDINPDNSRRKGKVGSEYCFQAEESCGWSVRSRSPLKGRPRRTPRRQQTTAVICSLLFALCSPLAAHRPIEHVVT